MARFVGPQAPAFRPAIESARYRWILRCCSGFRPEIIGRHLVEGPGAIGWKRALGQPGFRPSVDDCIAINVNAHVMRQLGLSRRHLFEAVERPSLAELPETDYEFAERGFARVSLDYHA